MATLPWWQSGVIYQLVVPSFQDTNGDGMGDLAGVTSRLDYLKWLGVGALWLSPVFPSPMADLGYDVQNFTDIDPRFGGLTEFDRLLAEAHQRKLRVLIDWVPNHTSDEHPWFMESRSSRRSRRRDWYIWRDGKADGSPPNNWLSVFGGRAWTRDDATGQYYLHSFLDKQPDLNWRNPSVRDGMFQTLRFWFDRDVDGVRIDAVDNIIKDNHFRDNPPNADYDEAKDMLPVDRLKPRYTRGRPEIHEILVSMRRLVEEYGDDRVLTGELQSPVEDMMRYYGTQQPELHLPLNLKLNWINWEADSLRSTIRQYHKHLPPGCWPTWSAGSHDCARLASRCPGDQRRVAAMLSLTLPGTPTLYYGDEIGMRGTPIPPEEAVDPQGRGTGRNRDPARTPMQWDTSLHAGFSQAEPWLPVSDDVHTANVAAQRDDQRSLLSLYRRLMLERATEPTLVTGQIELVDNTGPVIAYWRCGKQTRLLTILNTSGMPQTLNLPAWRGGKVCLSGFGDRDEERIGSQIHLRGDESLLLKADE